MSNLHTKGKVGMKMIVVIVIILFIGAVLVTIISKKSASGNRETEINKSTLAGLENGMTEDDIILSVGDMVGDFRAVSIETFDPSDMVYDPEVEEFFARKISLDEIKGTFFEGRVEFTGSTTVSGDYVYKEIFSEYCFNVDSVSADKIPRLGGDSRIPWFCFRNDVEVERDVEENGLTNRTIAIADYTYQVVGTAKSDLTTFVSAVE